MPRRAFLATTTASAPSVSLDVQSLIPTLLCSCYHVVLQHISVFGFVPIIPAGAVSCIIPTVFELLRGAWRHAQRSGGDPEMRRSRCGRAGLGRAGENDAAPRRGIDCGQLISAPRSVARCRPPASRLRSPTVLVVEHIDRFSQLRSPQSLHVAGCSAFKNAIRCVESPTPRNFEA
jgi:hypothetical protein